MTPTEIGLIALGAFVVMFLSHLAAIYFYNWRQDRFRKRMVEDFMSTIFERVKTEEDFNSIVERFRKDLNDGPNA